MPHAHPFIRTICQRSVPTIPALGAAHRRAIQRRIEEQAITRTMPTTCLESREGSSWIIEGAKAVIDAGFHINNRNASERLRAHIVRTATGSATLSTSADTGDGYSAASGDLYTQYRYFCQRTGDYNEAPHGFLYRDRVRRLYPQAYKEWTFLGRTAAQIRF